MGKKLDYNKVTMKKRIHRESREGHIPAYDYELLEKRKTRPKFSKYWHLSLIQSEDVAGLCALLNRKFRSLGNEAGEKMAREFEDRLRKCQQLSQAQLALILVKAAELQLLRKPKSW